MSNVADRGSLTDALLTQLLTVDFPVGDAGKPLHDENALRQAGWNGEPNTPGSFYVPYVVLTPATASISSGPFSDPQGDQQLPYTLSIFGVSRKQTESLANRARKILHALGGTDITLDSVDYSIQQIWFSAIGGVGRIDATDPSTYGEVDTFTVWLTK